jgi:hypothetical protein
MPKYTVYSRSVGLFPHYSDLIIKDYQGCILYSTKSKDHLFSSKRPQRHLYRGTPKSGTHIAVIGHPHHVSWDTGAMTPIGSVGFWGTRSFEHDGAEFTWVGFQRVIDKDGLPIASFRMVGGWFKAGELNITQKADVMLEVIVATFVARHWGWQIESSRR